MRQKKWLRRQAMQLQDPRYFQIIYLGMFLVFGVVELGWQADIWKFTAILVTALLTQTLGAYLFTKNYTSWKSGLITALGLCMLLKANSWQVLALGAFLAIASKFLIRVKGKHIFNPANFGIIMSILITGEAWISPGQWGSSLVLLYFIGAAALMILFRVGRLDTSAIFLLCLFSMEAAYSIAYLGWNWEVFMHKATNGTLLLYAFFMITDPVTTPNHKKARVIWSLSLAIISFILMNGFYLHTAPIWVLFFISPITAMLDRKYKAKKFNWLEPISNTNTIKIN